MEDADYDEDDEAGDDKEDVDDAIDGQCRLV